MERKGHSRDYAWPAAPAPEHSRQPPHCPPSAGQPDSELGGGRERGGTEESEWWRGSTAEDNSHEYATALRGSKLIIAICRVHNVVRVPNSPPEEMIAVGGICPTKCMHFIILQS